MPGFFEKVATVVVGLRDVLLVVLGALVSLLGTLLVEHRRAKDELRVKILSGTITRLTELEDLIALVVTQAGEGFKPLMATIASMTEDIAVGPSRWDDEMSSALEKLEVLVHALRRYPILTGAVRDFVAAARNVLGATQRHLLPEKSNEPKDRVTELHHCQVCLIDAARVVQYLVDSIIANDLKSDLTLWRRMQGFVRTPVWRLKAWWRRRTPGTLASI